MGAEFFTKIAEGKDAAMAFKDAVEDARYQHGHGGYTGTIAEKHRFIMATTEVLESSVAYQKAESLEDDRRFDKWGSAGCIEVKSTNPKIRMFLFFGWASS